MIPALSGLLNVHPQQVSPILKTTLFEYWWDNYAGGHPIDFGPTAAKPFEIYSEMEDGVIKQVDDSYKTLVMWIPLGVVFDAAYTQAAIAHLVDAEYDYVEDYFYAAKYYGAYHSQFAQRAIGAVTGRIDRATYVDLIRYVSPVGNDTENDCSDAGNPCATVSHAVGHANECDFLDLAAGTYNEPGLLLDKKLFIRGAGVLVE